MSINKELQMTTKKQQIPNCNPFPPRSKPIFRNQAVKNKYTLPSATIIMRVIRSQVLLMKRTRFVNYQEV